MSGMNSDQLHRSTLGIYSRLLDDFNPSLQKLVSLGNSYVQAFRALTLTSEAYFSALSRIGEKAFHTTSSRSLGEVLIQICENQRRLNTELDGAFRRFSMEVLQEMDNNIQLDIDYISGSRDHYEMEAQKQAALERQMRRGYSQPGSEQVQFLRESYMDALKEEERRYRFVAEKHCGLIQSVSHLMNKTGGALQQKAGIWMEEIGATRQTEARRPAAPDDARWMRQSREEPLGSIPSRAPSPQGSIHSRTGSVAGSGGRSMRARVSHQPAGSNPTLLPFARGQIITLLVQQPKNGWLYGRTEINSRQGWFPASFVEGVDEPPASPSFSRSTLNSSSRSNMSNFDQPRMSNHGAGPTPTPAPAPAPAPPPPPPPQSFSSSKKPEVQPVTAASNNWTQSKPENKRPDPHASRPELFPKGTNPFATVKLKPTKTDDRSAPRLNRR